MQLTPRFAQRRAPFFFFVASCLAFSSVSSRALERPVTIPSAQMIFRVPEEWIQPSEQMIRDIQKSEDKYVDRSSIHQPDFGIIRYPEPYDDINPTVGLRITPLGSYEGMTAHQIMPTTMALATTMRPGVKTVEKPVSFQIAGHPAARAVQSYLTDINGIYFEGRIAHWLIIKGDKIIYIYASYRADERNGTRKEIEKIINNIIFIK